MTSKQWKIVPVEATEEMEASASHMRDETAIQSYGGSPAIGDEYIAMVNAAPESDDELAERVALAIGAARMALTGSTTPKLPSDVAYAEAAIKEIGRQTDE